MKRVLPSWMTNGNQNSQNFNENNGQQINTRIKPIFDVSTEIPQEPSSSTNENAADEEENPRNVTADRDCVIFENQPPVIDLSDENDVETNQNSTTNSNQQNDGQPNSSDASVDQSSTSTIPAISVPVVKQEPEDDSSPTTSNNNNNKTDESVSTTKIKKEEIKSEPADSSTPALKPSCQFGIKCYMLNPNHRSQMAHPGDADYRRPTLPSPPPGTPDCPFGASCYRRNPDHFQRLNHPPSSVYHPTPVASNFRQQIFNNMNNGIVFPAPYLPNTIPQPFMLNMPPNVPNPNQRPNAKRKGRGGGRGGGGRGKARAAAKRARINFRHDDDDDDDNDDDDDDEDEDPFSGDDSTEEYVPGSYEDSSDDEEEDDDDDNNDNGIAT